MGWWRGLRGLKEWTYTHPVANLNYRIRVAAFLEAAPDIVPAANLVCVGNAIPVFRSAITLKDVLEAHPVAELMDKSVAHQ